MHDFIKLCNPYFWTVVSVWRIVLCLFCATLNAEVYSWVRLAEVGSFCPRWQDTPVATLFLSFLSIHYRLRFACPFCICHYQPFYCNMQRWILVFFSFMHLLLYIFIHVHTHSLTNMLNNSFKSSAHFHRLAIILKFTPMLSITS